MDENIETFVIYVSSLSLELIHLDKVTLIASLVIEKLTIMDKYFDFADVFWEQKSSMLLKRTEFNQYAIELQDDKQPPYGPIYSLKPMELETLKTCIKANLANGFIWLFKSPTSTSILFV